MAKYLFLLIFVLSIQFTSSRKPKLWKNGSYNSLYNLSRTDLAEFMAYKEKQYLRRKLHLRDECKEYSNHLTQHPSNYSNNRPLRFNVNPKDNLGICRIPKVASSSWLYKFNYLLENGQGLNFTNLPKHVLRKMHGSSYGHGYVCLYIFFKDFNFDLNFSKMVEPYKSRTNSLYEWFRK